MQVCCEPPPPSEQLDRDEEDLAGQQLVLQQERLGGLQLDPVDQHVADVALEREQRDEQLHREDRVRVQRQVRQREQVRRSGVGPGAAQTGKQRHESTGRGGDQYHQAELLQPAGVGRQGRTRHLHGPGQTSAHSPSGNTGPGDGFWWQQQW